MSIERIDGAAHVDGGLPSSDRPRLPRTVYGLAFGTFLMMTTEFVVAGILPEVAADLRISLEQAGALITVFAAGMVVSGPLMALLTVGLSHRLTLVLALVVFLIGHVVVAVSSQLWVLFVARFVTALATGAFWAVSSVVATRAAGPAKGARAIGVISAGGALATILGVPIGAVIAQFGGWRSTFWSLSVAAAIVTILVAWLVPASFRSDRDTPLRHQLAGLRSRELWLSLSACGLTTGGVLAAYSFISPVLTEQAGVASRLVPLVLIAFGVGSFIGTLVGGHFGDAHPGVITIVTPAVTVVVLIAISVTSGAPVVMTVLVFILGLFGLSANGVLLHLALRAAGGAATLGSALGVSAFNIGTALGTPLAGAMLATSWGTRGPPAVGGLIVSLVLVPTITLAVWRRRAARS